MRRLFCVTLLLALISGAIGCARDNPPAKDRADIKVVAEPSPRAKDDPPPAEGAKADSKDRAETPEERASRDKYETALADALSLLSDGKHADALVALETARGFDDNEFIRDEIAKVKRRLETESAAKRAIADIGTILAEGKAEDAGKLARDALREFADDKEAADRLARLRLEADALVAVEKKEDAALRFARWKAEGEAALKEDNLRAAVLALESALAAREDAALRKEVEPLRARLDKYDELRARAAELRKDAAQLEEALAALEEARTAWKTLQLLADIDETTLALSRRRDALSVADFDVRGDVGIADAGKTIAEEMLPHFRSRFDLVDRAALGKLIGELKLDATLDDPEDHRALGKLARVRYLVVGSIRRDSGITVNARLVDARTGLIEQTGKVVVASSEELWPALRDLARQLMMSDEEKIAFESERLRKAEKPLAVADDAPLPPPPGLPDPDAPPPPILVGDVPPPDVGGLKIADFDALPEAAPERVIVVPGGAAEARVKHRLLHTTLLLGDNCFRRGRFHDAHRHFEFALQLSPGNFDIVLRLDRCRPHLPPPVVVVPEPIVAIPARPRLALLNFVVVGDPRIVPPHLSHWTPQHLAPYFRHDFDIVDPGEVYWYMAKAGLTLRDLMADAHARRWLGRALGVRFFLLGTVNQTASFDVHTYLLDAELGHLAGRARVHVHSTFELKLRLHDLARRTLMSPAERKRWIDDDDRFEVLVVKGRRHLERREFALAINVFEDALRIRPRHVEALVYLDRCRHEAHLARIEAERRERWLAQKALEEEARRRHLALARATDLVRVSVVIGGPPPIIDRREAAAVHLVQEARVALKFKNFALSITKFEGALGLVPARDEWARELAFARIEADKHARLLARDAALAREAELRRLRDIEIAREQAILAKRHALELAARDAERKAQEARDSARYRDAFDEGQRLLVKGNYEAAIASLQLARRFKKTDAVEALLNQAFVRQAEAAALAKGEAERLALEKKLADERTRRKAAEAEAKRNQDLYQQALALAHTALDERKYDVAEARFLEAGKIFRTDAVLSGLKRTEAAKKKAIFEKEAAARKAAEDDLRADRVKKLITQGNAFFAARAFDKAKDAFLEAKRLAPENIDALAGLTRAQQAQERTLAEALRKTEEATRGKEFDRLLKSGQANLDAKQFEAAAIAFQEALRLKPADVAAKSLLAAAEKGRAATLADARVRAEAEKKALAYQKLLADGKAALAASRFDDAIKAFTDAQKVLPGDKSSADYLAEARSTKKKQEEAIALAAKMRAEELARAADFRKALDQARAALAGKDLAGAAKALAAAQKLDAKSAELAALERDVALAQKAAAAAVEAEKKRRTDYLSLVDRARAAWKSGQFDDALKTLASAGALFPEGKEAGDLVRQVQKARDDALKAGEEKTRLAQLDKLLTGARTLLKSGQIDEAARLLAEAEKLAPKNLAVAQALRDVQEARVKRDDRLKSDAAFNALVDQGQKALAGKRYEEAIKLFAQAMKLRPEDAMVALSHRDALAVYTQLQYQAAIDAGDAALKASRFEEAVKAFSQAATILPKDATAVKRLAQARAAWDDAKTAGAAAAKLKAAFADALSDGQKALKAKRFEEAVKAFAQAAKLIPGDPTAQSLLRQAQTALDNERRMEDETKKKKGMPPEDDKKKKAGSAEVARLIAAGEDFEKQGKFVEALKVYREADKLAPKDATIDAALVRVEFNWRLTEGQKHLEAKRFTEAVKELEAALRLFPGNPTATKLLEQARKGKKTK